MGMPLKKRGARTTRAVRRCLAVVALVSAASAGIASAGGSIDLGDSGDLHEGIGQSNLKTMLQLGSVYTASTFPVALRIRPSDALWGGVQLESGKYRFIQLAHQHASGTPPLTGVGYVTLESANGSTPSAATAIKRLHATPQIQAGPITSTRVAGFTGQQFDATVVGVDHTRYSPRGAGGISLAPFTPNRHCGFCSKTMHGETQDTKFAGTGQIFHIVALDVRGKTVVIYVESTYAIQPKYPPTKTFPTFLPSARQLLAKVSFGSG